MRPMDLEMRERFYFDQSILGNLLTLTDATSKSAAVIGVVVWLLENRKSFSWGLTPSGLTELIGVKVPFIEIDETGLPADPVNWAFEVRDRAFEKYCDVLTEFYLKSLVEKRLEICCTAIHPCDVLGVGMLSKYLNEPELVRQVVGPLSWQFLFQHRTTRKDQIDILLYIAWEMFRLGNAIDVFRLGDRLHWLMLSEKIPKTRNKKQIGKIQNNKDLLDSELLQMALLGQHDREADERTVIITQDFRYLPMRLFRAYQFFDYMLGAVARKGDEASIPFVRPARMVVFDKRYRVLECQADFLVDEYIKCEFLAGRYTPEYLYKD